MSVTVLLGLYYLVLQLIALSYLSCLLYRIMPERVVEYNLIIFTYPGLGTTALIDIVESNDSKRYYN
jgi:hypothetical protein